jgi:hypothetical protein
MKPLFILLLVIFCINISKQYSNIKPLNEQKAQTVALLECILGGDTFLKYFDNIMNSIEYKNTFKIIETVVSGFPENFKIAERDTVAYKQFGNSVVIDVIQYIGLEIGKYLRDVKQSQK